MFCRLSTSVDGSEASGGSNESEIEVAAIFFLPYLLIDPINCLLSMLFLGNMVFRRA